MIWASTASVCAAGAVGGQKRDLPWSPPRTGAHQTRDLEKLIVGILTDDDRCGAPPKFRPEQITDIIALACELAAESGLAVSHWTPPELAREALKRGIVENISPRQVDRFSEADLRPHKSQ